MCGGLFGFESGFQRQGHSCLSIPCAKPPAVAESSVALLTSISFAGGYCSWGQPVGCARSPFN
jgi:hypothetical protein